MDTPVYANERGMRVVALAGGVGGAKLAHGLAMVLPNENLTVIVNTGDDFDHVGLRICPDLDTVCYTLAGLANPVTGWGRSGETWQAFEAIKRLGGPDWFQLGDLDLGTHLERTQRLREGQSLSAVMADFCQAWGVKTKVLPMTDDRVATWVDTVEMGPLAFQEYFVHQHCQPTVKGFYFEGSNTAQPAPMVVEAIATADWIIFCPSNPWVSIGPILSVDGIRAALQGKCIAAVSPIIGGKAIKGPAAKMYAELGIEPSALAVARQYAGHLDVFIMDAIDHSFADSVSELEVEVFVTDTIMKDEDDRRRFAEAILTFLGTFKGRNNGL